MSRLGPDIAIVCRRCLSALYLVCVLLQTVNYDVSRLYMDIVALYSQVMLLMPRVVMMKYVLGLYHVTMELTSGTV